MKLAVPMNVESFYFCLLLSNLTCLIVCVIFGFSATDVKELCLVVSLKALYMILIIVHKFVMKVSYKLHLNV